MNKLYRQTKFTILKNSKKKRRKTKEKRKTIHHEVCLTQHGVRYVTAGFKLKTKSSIRLNVYYCAVICGGHGAGADFLQTLLMKFD